MTIPMDPDETHPDPEPETLDRWVDPMTDAEKIAKCVNGEWPDCVDVNCGLVCIPVIAASTKGPEQP